MVEASGVALVSEAGRPTQVLVVEDHAMVAQAIAYNLIEHGIGVQVSDGRVPQEVLDIAASFRPDVVLLDLYLDGAESLPLIAPLAAGGAKVIMVTGSTNRTIQGDCLVAGATAVIEKSADLLRLVAAVLDAEAGSAVMRPADKDELVRQSQDHSEQTSELAERFSALTSRERQVLAALVEGRPAEEIAEREFVSLATVRTHIRTLLKKLGVNSQLAAVALAARAGWTA